MVGRKTTLFVEVFIAALTPTSSCFFLGVHF